MMDLQCAYIGTVVKAIRERRSLVRRAMRRKIPGARRAA